MMRGGTAELREETGRWKGQPREERICTLCSVPEIEDVEHFLLRCGFFSEEQKALLAQMQKVGVEMDQKDEIHRHHSRGHNLFCYSAFL